jgi:hypothetical protein
MIELIPVVPVASASFDIVVRGEDFVYHYKTDYWFRFKVSAFPDWSCGTVIAAAMKDYGLDPTTVTSVMCRTFAGDMVELFPQ